MKITIRSVVLFAVLASMSSAFAGLKVSKAPKAEPKPEPKIETSFRNSGLSSESQTAITASLGAIDGNFAFGPGFQAEWPMVVEDKDYSIGFQTALIHSSTSTTTGGVKVSSRTWGLPLLLTGKYLIPTQVAFMKPYFAMSAGISIDRTTAKTNATGVEVSTSSTDPHFAFFFRPGVTFGEAQVWFAELPFGVMFTSFAVMPTIGHRF